MKLPHLLGHEVVQAIDRPDPYSRFLPTVSRERIALYTRASMAGDNSPFVEVGV